MRARSLPLLMALASLPACHKSSAPAAAATSPTTASPLTATSRAGHAVQTVFVIVMENRDWADVEGSPSAPYINHTLLPMGAHARRYFNPPGLHPSEPNYLWMEAGQAFGIRDDADPSAHHVASDQHLVDQLERAGISWKAYEEGTSGTVCPLTRQKRYVPKHDPFVYFDDITRGNDPLSQRCLAHVRPDEELDRDLQADAVPSYVFITPDTCHDMHDPFGCATADQVRNGDDWLSREVPKLLASQAYQRGGAIFITWDEGLGSDGPIGMIVLSPFAKKGYANALPYTHGSLLRTVQEIFGVGPALGDAAKANDLSDLFARFP